MQIKAQLCILVLILPFPLIHGLNLRHRSERIGLLVVFLLGGVTLIISIARFIGQLIVSNNTAICRFAYTTKLVQNWYCIDILAMTEYSVAIIILSLISLRPLLRKFYRVATSSQNNSPFSHSNLNSKMDKQRQSGAPPIGSGWKGPRTIYFENPPIRDMYGSEVELTELDTGKIYKTEDISITSAREADPIDRSKSNQNRGAINLAPQDRIRPWLAVINIISYI